MFAQAGLYLQQYSPDIPVENGRAIAENIAREFYQYGKSLQSKSPNQDALPQSTDIHLSEEEKQKVDEWLLGKHVYQKRMSRLWLNPWSDALEATRKELIATYFGVLASERKQDDIARQGLVGKFQHKAAEQIQRAIETPERNLHTSLFARGKENILTQMREAGWKKRVNNLFKQYDIDFSLEQKRLYDLLQIPTLRAELDAVRATGDVVKISEKELQVVKKIHRAINGFKCNEKLDTPVDVIKIQEINCLWASLLASTFLEEVGIKHVSVDLVKHATLIIVTSDQSEYYRDFSLPYFTRQSRAKVVNENSTTANLQDGRPIVLDLEYPDSVKKSLEVTLFPPEQGLEYQICNNLASYLCRTWRPQEWAEAFKHAIAIYQDPYECCSLGDVLVTLKKPKEALDAYKKALQKDKNYTPNLQWLWQLLFMMKEPKEVIPLYLEAIQINKKVPILYYWLGNSYYDLEQYEEARNAYEKVISLDPQYPHAHRNLWDSLRELKRYDEALIQYHEALKIAPTPGVYLGLWLTAYAQGNYAEALSLYEKAIQMNPKLPASYTYAGDALSQLGRKEEAITAYETCLSLWQGDEVVAEGLRKHIEKLKAE